MIISLNLDKKLIAAVDKVATKERRSRSQMVEMMLERATLRKK